MPWNIRWALMLGSLAFSFGNHTLPNPWHGMDTVAGFAFLAGAMISAAIFAPPPNPNSGTR